MINFSFEQLLRYFLAGGFLLLALGLSFEDGQQILLRTQSDSGSTLFFVGVSIIVGSVSYSAYRAVPYLPVYYVSAIIAGKFIGPDSQFRSVEQQEIARWVKRSNGGLWDNTKEWANQVHFLMGCGFNGITMALWGHLTEQTKSEHFVSVLVFSVLLFAFACVSNVRLLIREVNLEKHYKSEDAEV